MRAILSALAVVATTAAPALADDPEELSGIAVGVAVGEPSAVTGRFSVVPGKVHVDAAVGTGTLAGVGLEMHAGVTFVPVKVTPVLPIYVGLGARYYHHGYDAASVDELPDTHAGVRVAIGAAYQLPGPRLEIYGEAAPGWDLYRSDSCSLVSGVMSLCPHADSTRAFVSAMVGVRWYLK